MRLKITGKLGTAFEEEIKSINVDLDKDDLSISYFDEFSIIIINESCFLFEKSGLSFDYIKD